MCVYIYICITSKRNAKQLIPKVIQLQAQIQAFAITLLQIQSQALDNIYIQGLHSPIYKTCTYAQIHPIRNKNMISTTQMKHYTCPNIKCSIFQYKIKYSPPRRPSTDDWNTDKTLTERGDISREI